MIGEFELDYTIDLHEEVLQFVNTFMRVPVEVLIEYFSPIEEEAIAYVIKALHRQRLIETRTYKLTSDTTIDVVECHRLFNHPDRIDRVESREYILAAWLLSAYGVEQIRNYYTMKSATRMLFTERGDPIKINTGHSITPIGAERRLKPGEFTSLSQMNSIPPEENTTEDKVYDVTFVDSVDAVARNLKVQLAHKMWQQTLIRGESDIEPVDYIQHIAVVSNHDVGKEMLGMGFSHYCLFEKLNSSSGVAALAPHIYRKQS